MGGKNKSVQTGWKYRVAFHHGLVGHPIDAFLEFRAAQKTAWSGRLTDTGTITINQPNLFGGDKDQGGIVGDVDVLFGKTGQTPNAYLLSEFGSQVPGWEGVTTLVFKGGGYGSNNPYPQKPAYKIEAITQGWDTSCWYPEKAVVAVAADSLLPADASGWDYQVLPEESNPGYDNLAIPTTGWSLDGQAPFGSGPSLPSPANTAWPGHTVLWLRRTVTLAGNAAQTLRITAENGCVVFINGAIAAANNRANADIPYNDSNVVSIPLNAGQSYDIAVKAFDEIPVYPDDRTFLTIEVSAPGVNAMNPAHILYEARTAQDRGGEPSSSMADANWKTGADWFYSHGFGLCPTYDPDSESVDEFIDRISKTAGCAVNRDPTDGLWYLDIANGVYTLAELPILTDDDILDWDDSPRVIDDTINSIAVEYYDPQQWRSVTTRPVTALAMISANGLNHHVNQYPEIPTSDLANRVALRDLADAITPTHAFSGTTTRKPYKWRRNTYVRLQSPKKGIADMVCLLAEKSDGTLKSGAMKITLAQDIYGLATTSYMDSEPGVDPRPPQIPLAIADQAAFEAPYFELVRNLSRADLAAVPSDAGYLMTVAKDPSTSSLDYSLTVSIDDGATYAGDAIGHWCPSALVVDGDTLTEGLQTDFTLSGGALLDQVLLGSGALWDDEVVRVDAIDPDAGTVTLARGCADTVPAFHAANSRIWFFDGFSGKDTTEYTDAETVDIELLTNTGTAQLDPGLARPMDLTFDQRQFRAYPPADVLINGVAYPAIISGDLAITGVHRDRLTQADQLLDTTHPGVGPEAGTSYTLRLYNENNALVRTEAILSSPVYTWANADEIADSGIVDDTSPGLWTPALLAVPPVQWNNNDSGVTLDGSGNVTIWNDLSASHANQWVGYLTNPTPVTGQNGHRVIRFNGSQAMAAPYSKSLTKNITQFAMFFAGSPAKNSGSVKLVLSYSIGINGNARAEIDTASNLMYARQRRLDSDSVALTSQTQPDSNFHLYASEHDWTAQTVGLRIDGGAATSAPTGQGSGPTSNTNSDGVALMGSVVTPGAYTAGDVGEILILNYIPSTLDRQLIEGYLAWKWGIESNLPSGHPYKAAAPVAGGGGTLYRINGRIRFELEAVRDSVTSFQRHDITVRRAGYGFNYGMFYGGPP